MCHIVPFKSLFHPAPTLAKKGNADAQRLLPQRRFFGSLLERTCNDNWEDKGFFFFELRYIIWFSMMFNQIILNMIRISGVSEYGCMVQISHHRGSREAWKTKNHSYVDHFWRYFDGQGQKLKSTVQNRQSTVQNPIPLISLILDGWDYNNRRPVLWHAQHQDPSSFQRETFAAASASPCQQSAVWPFSKG